MMRGGARWAIDAATAWRRPGTDRRARLRRRRRPAAVSITRNSASGDEMGTLGSGNHYLEVQLVAARFTMRRSPPPSASPRADVVVSIHCGSRGLGHQVGTDYPGAMLAAAAAGMASPCRTASLPARRSRRREASTIWARCARRSIARSPIARSWPICARERVRRSSSRSAGWHLLYDVSHNTCKAGDHDVGTGKPRHCSCTARARRARSARACGPARALRAVDSRC